MSKQEVKLITTSELFFTLIGRIVGSGILSIPSSIVTVAKQDGWISAIVGSIYPLYIVGVGSIIISKHPEKNIMDISKLYLGKILGNFLNFLFMAQFLFYIVSVISSASNVLRVFAVWFMSPIKIMLVMTILIAYTSYTGLKSISKLNTVIFFIITINMLIAFLSLKYGSLLNVQPVFGSGFNSMIKGSIETAYNYGNMELLLIIHPYVKNKKTIVKVAFLATIVITFIYTLTIFLTIFYLGVDIVPKSLWPFFFVSESVKIPVITNFRFITMAFWIFVIIKTAATEYYAATCILNNTFNKLSRTTACFCLAPIILFMPLLFEYEVFSRDLVSKILPWITVLNIAYVTLLVVITAIKNRKCVS